MTDANQGVAALLGSRICHDLISPLGAISNGVELLTMTRDAQGPEVDLISESIENANARIRFFRVAYGAAAEDQMVGGPEIRSILADLTRGTKLTVTWNQEADMPRREVKLTFLLVQCLEMALPWGGEIAIDRTNSRWTLQGKAARMKIDDRLWDLLSRPGASPQVRAAEVQFLLVPQLIRDAGRELTLSIDDTSVTIQF